MPYETELQRHLDIFALSLSLKKNNRWSPEDDKVNYPLLFSIYIKMIQQDEQFLFYYSSHTTFSYFKADDFK